MGSLWGDEGNDTFYVGPEERHYGGEGNDLFIFSLGSQSSTWDQWPGTAIVDGGTGSDTLRLSHSNEDKSIFNNLYADGIGYETTNRGEPGYGFSTFAFGMSNIDRIEAYGTTRNVYHGSNATIEVVTQNANDTFYGGSGSEVFRGGGGNDVFWDNPGPGLADTPDGSDVWYGGAGADTFHVRTGEGGNVKIADFSAAQGDKLFVNGIQQASDADWLFA